MVDIDHPYENIFSYLVHDTLMNTFEIVETNHVIVIRSYKNKLDLKANVSGCLNKMCISSHLASESVLRDHLTYSMEQSPS